MRPSMKKKYIGLTIGPIYKTLKNAKKTRELWGGSYIFSYIMKLVIKRFKDRKFIIPYVDCNDKEFERLLSDKMPVGIFHDRLIFESENNDFDELRAEIDKSLTYIADQIFGQIANHIKADTKAVTSFIKAYFQLYFCEIEFDENTGYKKINKEINGYLDSLELQESFIPEEEENYVADFLLNVKNSFLIKEAFEKNIRFKSVPEIAVASLNLENNTKNYKLIFENYDEKSEDEDYNIYQHIKDEYKINNIYQHCKYMAIVHADGDYMGDTIKGLESNEEFKAFSKKLFNFDLSAPKAIEAFGGEPIFAGGDDLLFFAPVVNKNKTVFDLLYTIDDIFNKQFADRKKKPTLSFGVSISYYKFPLYEALEISKNLLKRAKKMKNKNAITFRMLKHSGQYFEAVFKKQSPEYKFLLNLLKDIDPVKDINPANEDEKLMSSIIYTLFTSQALLEAVGNDKDKLDNFFTNSFNEPIHKIDHNKAQIESIKDLIYEIYQSGNYKKEERTRIIYSTLRLNKFIRG